MAKVKFGMMMTDASGKLGGQVFSKNRSGSYVRTKSTPSNPQSVAQQNIRAILSAVSSNWSDLTDEQRESFNSVVEDWKKTDIFGDLKRPTGKNLYSALNINLINSDQPPIVVAPAKTEIPFVDLQSVVVDISLGEVQLNYPTALDGFQVIVSATPMLSQGTSFYKGKFRDILVFAGATDVASAIYDAYVARFGAPIVGSNIAFRLKLIASNGQAGVPIVAKSSVVA